MNIAYESDRLLLRHLTDADAQNLFALDSDPEVRRFLHLAPPTSTEPYLEAIRGRYHRYYETTPGRGYWAVVEKASGTFVGWFHLRPGEDFKYAETCGFATGDVDLGYRLKREFWGQGYATEMSRVLAVAALADPTTVRLVGTTLEANLASRRVLEKTGLTVAREGVQLPGIEAPAVVYAKNRNNR